MGLVHESSDEQWSNEHLDKESYQHQIEVEFYSMASNYAQLHQLNDQLVKLQHT